MKIYLVMCVFPVTTLVIQPWRLPDWMKCVNVMTTMNQRTDGRCVTYLLWIRVVVLPSRPVSVHNLGGLWTPDGCKGHERRGRRSWKTWTKVMKDVDKGHERRGPRSWKTWTTVMKDVDQGHERRGQKSGKMWTVDYLMWGVHRQLLDRPPESCVDKPWQTDL